MQLRSRMCVEPYFLNTHTYTLYDAYIKWQLYFLPYHNQNVLCLSARNRGFKSTDTTPLAAIFSFWEWGAG